MKLSLLFGALVVLFASFGTASVSAEEGRWLKADTKAELRSWFALPIFAQKNEVSAEVKADLKLEHKGAKENATSEIREKKEEYKTLAADLRADLKSSLLFLKTKATSTKEKVKEHAKEEWRHAPGLWKRFALFLGFNAETTNEQNPLLLKVKAAAAGTSTVHLFWMSDEKTTSTVYYSTGSSAVVASTTPSLSSAKFSYFHHVKLPSLSADTTYHYRIVSTDKGGETSISNDFTFKTDSN